MQDPLLLLDNLSVQNALQEPILYHLGKHVAPVLLVVLAPPLLLAAALKALTVLMEPLPVYHAHSATAVHHRLQHLLPAQVVRRLPLGAPIALHVQLVLHALVGCRLCVLKVHTPLVGLFHHAPLAPPDNIPVQLGLQHALHAPLAIVAPIVQQGFPRPALVEPIQWEEPQTVHHAPLEATTPNQGKALAMSVLQDIAAPIQLPHLRLVDLVPSAQEQL